jgi:hypothetical protein
LAWVITFPIIIVLVLRTENLVPRKTGIPHNERFYLAPINQNFKNSRIQKKSSRQCESFQHQFGALFQHGTPPKILYSLVFILRYISSIRISQISVASRKHACHMRVTTFRELATCLATRRLIALLTSPACLNWESSWTARCAHFRRETFTTHSHGRFAEPKLRARSHISR